MRVYLNQTTYEASIERINRLYDEFEEIFVWTSGGKDSTVVFNLAMEVAKKRGKLPLKVGFVDQETEWAATIEQIKIVMYDKNVEPYWHQIAFTLDNATSFETQNIICWNPEKKHLWLREQDPIAIKENIYNSFHIKKLLDKIPDTLFKDKKTAVLSGVRCLESPRRWMGLTVALTYKDITWGKKHPIPDHFTFYPIYDWSIRDVWKYIFDNKLPYNSIYDAQFQHGEPLNAMRVSYLLHEQAMASLFYLQEAEPDTYAKLTKRVPGVDSAGKLTTDIMPKTLPYMFKSWMDYRDYLLEKLVNVQHHKMFKFHFKQDDEKAKEMGIEDAIHRRHIQAILQNDQTGVMLDSIRESICRIKFQRETDERIRKYDKK